MCHLECRSTASVGQQPLVLVVVAAVPALQRMHFEGTQVSKKHSPNTSIVQQLRVAALKLMHAEGALVSHADPSQVATSSSALHVYHTLHEQS